MKNCIEQSGRSMLEILGVLAIVGVLSVGGLAGYSRAMENYLVNQRVNDLATVVAGIEDLRNSISNNDSISLDDMFNAGVFPDDAVMDVTGGENGTNIVKLPSGIVMDVEIDGDSIQFEMAIQGGSYACQQFLTKDWRSIMNVYVIVGLPSSEGGEAFYAYAPELLSLGPPGASNLPVNPSDAADFCEEIPSVPAEIGTSLGIGGQWFVLMIAVGVPSVMGGGEIPPMEGD